MIDEWLPFPTTRDKISGAESWRNLVLRPFIFEREGGVCWVDGCYYTATDIHEAILSRQDVRGWKLKYRVLIHTPFNCIAVCKEHHKWIPRKEEVFEWMVNEYGIQVIEWFNSLPFRGRNPVQGLIDGREFDA